VLVINADDWGRSERETDAALRCSKAGRVTSVSAMVFMQDSERAASLAIQDGLDVGLHLNFTESFTSTHYGRALENCHNRIGRFLRGNKYSQVLYNPFLRQEFASSCEAQLDEFMRLYRKAPSHIDGHHHMHLCANMLLSRVIPTGMKVRRNFSFWPGEKSLWNRAYRGVVDRWLATRYYLTDYFFDLTQCIEQKKLKRVEELTKSSTVELMTHPIIQSEIEYLMSNEFGKLLQRVEIGGYALV